LVSWCEVKEGFVFPDEASFLFLRGNGRGPTVGDADTATGIRDRHRRLHGGTPRAEGGLSPLPHKKVGQRERRGHNPSAAGREAHGFW